MAIVFEAELAISAPWSVATVEFDEAAKLLTVLIDFEPGSRFAIGGHEGVHPVHDNGGQDLPALEPLPARVLPAGDGPANLPLAILGTLNVCSPDKQGASNQGFLCPRIRNKVNDGDRSEMA